MIKRLFKWGSIPTQRRINDGANGIQFKSPEEYYKKIFYEMLDNVSSCLVSQMSSTSIKLLQLTEKFVIGKSTNEEDKEVIEFYADDIDRERLLLHRSMFFDILRSRNVIVNVFKKDLLLADMLQVFVKFTHIILTMPVSTCTAERSFSSLRRVKSYTRSTMVQARLNDIAILHTHRELAASIIDDEFIQRNYLRRKTFSLTLET